MTLEKILGYFGTYTAGVDGAVSSLSVRVSHQPWFRSYCDLSGPRHRQALRASEKICNSRSCGLRPAVLYRSRHSKGIWRDGLFLRCQDHPGPVPEHFLYVRGLRLQLEADPARRRQAVHHDRCGRLPADHPSGRAGRTGGQPHRDGPLLALQCSSASMSGGVGTASAFGPIFID